MVRSVQPGSVAAEVEMSSERCIGEPVQLPDEPLRLAPRWKTVQCGLFLPLPSAVAAVQPSVSLVTAGSQTCRYPDNVYLQLSLG